MSDNPYGKVETEGGEVCILFERRFNHTPERIWLALTDADELRQWFMADAKIEGKAGGKVEMVTGMSRFLWSGTVLAWVPFKLFEYEAKIAPHQHLPGGENVLVRWELTEVAGGTVVRLTHRRLSQRTASGFAPGIHTYLDRLGAQLDGLQLPNWMERYSAVRQAYTV
jgi:uncharacterized protein YndB with AHSA1/START domain